MYGSFYGGDLDCLCHDRGKDSHFLTDSHYFEVETIGQTAFSLSMIIIELWALKGILALKSLPRTG